MRFFSQRYDVVCSKGELLLKLQLTVSRGLKLFAATEFDLQVFTLESRNLCTRSKFPAAHECGKLFQGMAS